MNNESYDVVDHCDYLEIENITPKTLPPRQSKYIANECPGTS